jgi:hypothetical protein
LSLIWLSEYCLLQSTDRSWVPVEHCITCCLPPPPFFWWEGGGVSPSPYPPQKDIPLSSVHSFVLSSFCYHSCSLRMCHAVVMSHLAWPLTVLHAIYHFAFIFCNFWDTFSSKCGRYSYHKEWFMWHIKKCFLMALTGYKIGTVCFQLVNNL